MAVFTFTNAVITINSVDLSDHITKATLKIEVDEQESTAFGSTYKSRVGGLKDGSLELEFNQDFASSEVDDTIWPILGTVVPFTIRANSGSVSATNPEYSGTVLIKEYSPLDGSVGDLAKFSVTWPTSGTVVRSTS